MTNDKTNLMAAEKRARAFGTVGKVFIYIMLVFWALMVLFPFYYMILTSLKSQGAYNSEFTPKLYTLAPTLENFRTAFSAVPLGKDNLILKLSEGFSSLSAWNVLPLLQAFFRSHLLNRGYPDQASSAQ